MFEPSPVKLLILVVILLLILGPKRVPQVARSIGRGVRELRESIAGEDRAEDAPDPGARAVAQAAEVAEARQAPPAPTREIATAEALDEQAAARRPDA